MCFGEEREMIRLHDLCSRGMTGSQALVELLNPLPGLSLLRQRPAPQERTACPPERKALFCREANGGFGALLGSTYFAAELMENSRTT